MAVLRSQYALVAADTSDSKADPSGSLLVIDVRTRATVAEIDLGGQPDSVKVSPDHRFVAISIENERDEEIVVDDVEGGLPQPPAGYLTVIETKGHPASWVRQDVPPTDPEPEFVDINQANQAVVTLQENNHIVIVDLPSRTVIDHFPASGASQGGVEVRGAGRPHLSE